jgi:dienelactone hydrolase
VSARRRMVRIGAIALALMLVALAGFVAWAAVPARPMAEAVAALAGDDEVVVTVDRWLVFEPASGEAQIGLVFYPGGRVDPTAYAPAMRALAQQGVLAVIVPMPLNLAVLNPAAAKEVIAAYPGVSHWAVGGHSLGGAMAANYARRNPGVLAALVLWASYPAASDDLSASGLRALSIYGTRDGLTTLEDVTASAARLPADTWWTPIEGGNHAQFGWYGEQAGDNPAAITRPDQQAQALEATLRLLCTLGPCRP